MNAAQKFVEDQINEMPVEARIAKLESCAEYIKLDLPRVHRKIDAANEGIVALEKKVDVLSTTQTALVKQVDHIAAMQVTMAKQIENISVTQAIIGKQVENLSAAQITFGRQVENLSATQVTLGRQVENLSATQAGLATRAELNKLESTMIRWFVGTAIAIAAVAFGVARGLSMAANAPAGPGPTAASAGPEAAISIAK